MSDISLKPEEDKYARSRHAKRFYYTVVFSALITAAFFLKDPVAGLFHGEKKAEAPAAQKAAKKERKILYWYDPMLADFKSDKPGKSPMGMDLIPKYEDEGSGEGLVKVDPSVTQTIGVRTASAMRMDISPEIRAAGVVAPDETKLYRVQTKAAGWVEKLYVNSTGERVQKDQIMLELYSPDLVNAEEEFLLALRYRDSLKSSGDAAVAASGQQLYDSALRRLKLLYIPEHQIKELEADRKVKQTLHIHSPANGVLMKKDVVQGMYIEPNTMLYEIADLSSVWVYADVFEYEIRHLKPGQKTSVTLTALPGEKFEGKISYVYPYLDPKSRSIKVRIDLANPKMMIKPEMYGDVVIKAGGVVNALTVPSEAVINTGERKVLFVVKGEGKFEPREVKTGISGSGFVEILSGLSDGEKVVVSSQFLIDSESKLSEAMRKMGAQTPAMPQEHQHGGQAAPANAGKPSDEKPAATPAHNHNHEATPKPSTTPKSSDGMGEMKGMDHGDMKGMDHGDMKGMDHGDMKGMDHGDMKGMDHGDMKGMDHGDMKGMDHGDMKGMDHGDMKGMDHGDMPAMDHSTHQH